MKKLIFLSLVLILSEINAVCQSSGKIVLNKDFYESLKKLHGDNLFKNELILDVWRVDYVSVNVNKSGTKSSITRIYLQEKTIGSIKLTEESSNRKVNLKFTLPKLSNSNDYILVYSLGSYPKEFQTVKLDHKANDGSNRSNIEYQSNIASKTNIKNKKWGMVSIDKIGKQYNLEIFSSMNVVQFGVLSFIKENFLDPVLDGAELAWEGINNLSCFLVGSDLGNILVKIGTVTLTLVKEDGVIIPRNREITLSEYQWANEKIFNGNLPPRDKIIISNLLGKDKRPFVFPACGKLTMHLGSKGFDNPINWKNSNSQIVGQNFIHELTHAWQISKIDDLDFVKTSLNDQLLIPSNILYSFNCGGLWNSYKFEQQATAVENCFIKREKGISNSCEEKYIVDNVRKGVPFRTLECIKLLAEIDKIKDKITARIKKLKEDYLKSIGETIALHADGTPKVGNEKGLDNVKLPVDIMEKDEVLKSLNVKLKPLEFKKKNIKCQ